jgi:outer membrane protein
MKHCFTISLLFFLFCHIQAKGQATEPTVFPKIGYTNIEIVLSKLPESRTMQNELEITKSQLEKAMDEAMKEFQSKVDIYQKNGAQMTDLIRADKEKELENLQGRIQQMRNNAQQSLQNKQQQLLDPILLKINGAIQEVGKENSFVYILNMEAGPATTPFILFVSSEENDVTNLILKKLGVDPGKPIATPQKPETKTAKPDNVNAPKPAAPKQNTPAKPDKK